MNIRSLEFHLAETWQNIARNALMSAASITNAAACLFVLGGFLLTGWNLARINERLANETRVVIFMRADATVGEATQLAVDLQRRFLDLIADFHVASQEENLENFRRRYPGIPVEGLREDNPFPVSIEIELKNPLRYEVLVAAARADPRVDQVNAGQKVLDKLVRLRSLSALVGLCLLVLLGGASLLTIGNTILLTINARRREIDIMQMVGATGWFIRMPFVLEGVFHGIVGAVVGGALLLASYRALAAWVADSLPAVAPPVVAPLEMAAVALLLIAAGALFGLIGSMASLQRYLKV